jgi:hypothetical protein
LLDRACLGGVQKPRNTASSLVSLILLGGASMLSIRSACAGNVVSVPPASHSAQIMLYVSQPLWSRGDSSLPLYGLWIGKLPTPPTTPQRAAIAPFQRSELIDLQILAHSDVRLEFGRRLIWNITRGTFGPQSSQSVPAIGVQIKGIGLSDTVRQQPWNPGTSRMSALVGNPVRRRQVDGESLPIVDTVISSQWTPSAGRAAYLQLRPTVQFANGQRTEAVLVLRGAGTR